MSRRALRLVAAVAAMMEPQAPPRPTLGAAIVRAIVAANVSVASLPDKLGVEPVFLGALIAGEEKLTPELVKKLAFVLGESERYWGQWL